LWGAEAVNVLAHRKIGACPALKAVDVFELAHHTCEESLGTGFALEQTPRNAKMPPLFTSMLPLHESKVGRRLGCNLRCGVGLRVLAIQYR